MPIKDLVIRNGTEGCMPLLANCEKECGAADVYNAWGVPFMNSVYATFNVENRTVVLSNVVWRDKERVEGLSA